MNDRLMQFAQDALPFARLGFVLCVLVCALLATYDFALRVLAHNSTYLDFTVFWTAARFDRVYDAIAFTRAQLSHLPPDPTLRPFPYPPTALLFLRPLRWLSFDTGVMVWTAVSITTFLFASRLYGSAGLLALFAPMVALSVLAGQATLLLGGALAAGVALIERRPIFAGFLFGIVGAVKPTMAALVPFAVIASGSRKVLITSILTGAGVVGISLLLGPSLWLEWIQSMPRFLAQVTGRGFRTTNMAPGLWFAPLGVMGVLYVFRVSRSADLRLLALVSGTACCTPYMMGYDMATMAPGSASLMLKRNPLAWIVGAVAFAFVFLRLVPIIAIGVIVLAAFERWIHGRMGPQLNNLWIRRAVARPSVQSS